MGSRSDRGPLSYTVKLQDGKIIRRHVDHLRDRCTFTSTKCTYPGFDVFPHQSSELSSRSEPSTNVPVRRYPQRDRRPLDRLVMRFWTYTFNRGGNVVF